MEGRGSMEETTVHRGDKGPEGTTVWREQSVEGTRVQRGQGSMEGTRFYGGDDRPWRGQQSAEGTRVQRG